jgi:hypothetical protein
MRIALALLLSLTVYLVDCAARGQDAVENPAPISDRGESANIESAETTDTATPEPVDPDVIRIHLMDGSTITGKLSLADLEVETSFGTLQVPIASIRSFTPGLGSHPEMARNIDSLIEDLGSGVYGKREAAHKALQKLGPPVRAELELRADDADNERRTRIKELLEEFDELESEAEVDPDAAGWTDSRPLIRRDTIVTTDFTIVGRIVPQSFTITSLYGPLTVKLGDIRAGERDAPKGELRKNVRVEGANLVQSNMLGTGLRLERGDRVTISAEGTITMSPWGNQAQSGPDGAANFGWYLPNQIPVGTLVARIGNQGAVFKAGSKHNFTADRAGTLYLGFAMLPDYANNQFPGEYRVKLRVQRK